MYSIDNLDKVVKLDDVPTPETGAPLPMVLADEYGVILSYIPSGKDPFVFVRFRIPLMHMFGPPNDEALEGHPLWQRGLDYYGVFKVEQSSLVRRFALMNRVHRQHSSALFEKFNHYIFTFHDSTFECVAESFEIQIVESQQDERHVGMHRFLLSNRGKAPISPPNAGRIPLGTKLRWWLTALNPYDR